MNTELLEFLSKKEPTKRAKVLAVLSSVHQPALSTSLSKTAKDHGLRLAASTIGAHLAAADKYAVRTPEGWTITKAGLDHVRQAGYTPESEAKNRNLFLEELTAAAESIRNEHASKFVLEAIACAKAGATRATVVFSWIGAFAVLKENAWEEHHGDLQAEIIRRGLLKRNPKTQHDLIQIKERDLLDVFQSVSLIDKSVKNLLIECLDRRNTCGHPNSARIGEATLAHHLEVLINNVFTRFHPTQN